MPAKKIESKELSEEQLAFLNESYPVVDEGNRLTLPRFGMLSKDIIEETGSGKTKKIKVIEAAGTFFTETDEGETDEKGKKVWTKKFFPDESMDVIIVYHRRQLKKYESSLKKYTSSPIFDNAQQVIPLYSNKEIIERGTQAELQALYPALTEKGKPTSDLKEEAILYVLLDGVLHQSNISQSSKWNFKTYAKGLNPSTVITTISPVEDTFGTNTFMKMAFTKKRSITSDEFHDVAQSQEIIKEEVKQNNQYFLNTAAGGNEQLEHNKRKNAEFDAIPEGEEEDDIVKHASKKF